MMQSSSRSDMNCSGHSARLAVLWNTGFALRALFQFGLTQVLARLLMPR